MNVGDWDAWLASLSEGQQVAAIDLLHRFEQAGADDPRGWARSEIDEGFPQFARFLLLRQLWKHAIANWEAAGEIEGNYSAKKLVDAGADPEQVVRAMRGAAFDALMVLIGVIDEGHDPGGPNDWPGWILVETDGNADPTGRHVAALHEDFLAMDPSGQGGDELWD